MYFGFCLFCPNWPLNLTSLLWTGPSTGQASTRTAGLGRKLFPTEGFSISNQKKMDVSNDMERRQKFERNVKNYLEAMDKIQLDIVKMLEESMKLNEILQDAGRFPTSWTIFGTEQPKNSSRKRSIKNRKPKCKMPFQFEIWFCKFFKTKFLLKDTCWNVIENLFLEIWWFPEWFFGEWWKITSK